MPSHQGVSAVWGGITNAAKLFIKLSLPFWAPIPPCAAVLPLLTQGECTGVRNCCHTLLISGNLCPNLKPSMTFCFNYLFTLLTQEEWIAQHQGFIKTGPKKEKISAVPIHLFSHLRLIVELFLSLWLTLVHTSHVQHLLSTGSSCLPTQHQTAGRHKSCLHKHQDRLRLIC